MDGFLPNGVNTKMARLCGWAWAPERCTYAVPFGYWTKMTFIAGLRHYSIAAPWVIDEPAIPSKSIFVRSSPPSS
jgi:hypothetical protein